MCSEPYEVWISIYNDEIKSTYEEERYELRKISMIYCAFETELNRLKSSLSDEITEVRTKLKRKDILQKCKNFAGFAESEYFDVNIQDSNKENETPEIVPLKSTNLDNVKSEDFFVASTNSPTFFENAQSPPPITQDVESTSPVIKKHVSSKKNHAPNISILYPTISHKAEKTPSTIKRKSDEFQTPENPNDSNIMECSIIEDTPEVNFSKKGKTKLSLSKPKKSKKPQPKQKSTLTQMFSQVKTNKKREIDSNGPSMNISEMIYVINESSDSETDAELDKSNDTTTDDLETSLEKESPKNNVLQSFIQNYDKVPEKKSEESPEFVHKEPVVRGKERKKLKGWSCRECEQYYEGLNLPPEELEKKKDFCSRHRHKFQPRDDTYQGFWDLTFGPTPPTQDSIIFKSKKQ